MIQAWRTQAKEMGCLFIFSFVSLDLTIRLNWSKVGNNYRKLLFAKKFLTKLRWLKTVSSTVQDIDFDGSLLPLFISWYYNHGIKKLPNHWWTCWYYFCDTIGYHSNTMTCLKTPLIPALSAYISKMTQWHFFLLYKFDK